MEDNDFISSPAEILLMGWVRQRKQAGLPERAVFLIYEALFPVESLEWARVSFAPGVLLIQCP